MRARRLVAVRINVGNIVKRVLTAVVRVTINVGIRTMSGIVIVIMIVIIVMLLDLFNFENLQMLPRRR